MTLKLFFYLFLKFSLNIGMITVILFSEIMVRKYTSGSKIHKKRIKDEEEINKQNAFLDIFVTKKPQVYPSFVLIIVIITIV